MYYFYHWRPILIYEAAHSEDMAPECPSCDRQFDSERGVRVHHAHAHGDPLPNRECAACGTEFYSEYERKYCSDDCREEAVSRAGEDNPNYSGAKQETSCEQCETSFEYYPSEKPGRFCNECVEAGGWRHTVPLTGEDSPRYDGGQIEITCDTCGSRFERYPNAVNDDVNFCSKACQAAWLSKAFTGEGHPNYEGGPTGDYGPGWRRVRRRALERDGRECVLCGATPDEIGRNSDVHHIVPVRAFLDASGTTLADAHTLDNLVTLCPGCHRRADHGRVSAAELRHRVGLG